MEGSFNMSEYMGLTQKQAQERLKEQGENRLESAKKQSILKIFCSQFKDIMVMILLGATVISVVMGEIYEAVTIIAIVLLDAILGFAQEYKTEKTLKALEDMTAPMATVIRDGRETKIPATEVVLGDAVKISTGDRVAADGEVMRYAGLECDESLLTGESEGVAKKTGSRVYMGTTVTRGNGVFKVTATGKNTEMGRVSSLIKEVKDEKTPLQKRLGTLGKGLCAICIGVCIVVALAGILRGEEVFDMLMVGITIAIAAIPEGLPATVTIALALAVRRMVKANTLVHKLHSVETLGCTGVICTDKTGTITENKMTVRKIYSGDKEYDFTGVGYYTEGEMMLDGQKADRSKISEMLKCFTLCSNATIKNLGDEYEVMGNPTEAALLIAAAKAGEYGQRAGYKRIDEIPFDSEAKKMSVTMRSPDGVVTYTKGALDRIFDECGYISDDVGIRAIAKGDKEAYFGKAEKYAKKAMRVMAFAFTDSSGRKIFLGIAGLTDPPKKEAKDAVTACRQAGIKVVMITGDSQGTAEAIAKQVGILRIGGKSLSKAELDGMDDSELAKVIDKISVFSRVTPKDKLRIVRAFKSRGQVVAMTGDGVNDAPAIKEADIGVAMGKSGTEVCKQASDIILTDDNFATLTTAVKQGRTVYSNIRKFVRYLISCNIGEVVVMFLSIVMGLPVVLVPTQILLVNLVTDGLPAMALGLEKSEDEIMKMKPREFQRGFFAGGLMSKIILRGLLIGACTLGCFVYVLSLGYDLDSARTCALVTLIASQLVHVFECRSEIKSVFLMNPFGNMAVVGAVAVSALATLACIYIEPLMVVMQTAPISGMLMAVAIGFALAVPVVAGLMRIVVRKR